MINRHSFKKTASAFVVLCSTLALVLPNSLAVARTDPNHVQIASASVPSSAAVARVDPSVKKPASTVPSAQSGDALTVLDPEQEEGILEYEQIFYPHFGDIKDFSQVTDLVLPAGGNARIVEGEDQQPFLRLTDAEPYQVGAAWYREQQRVGDGFDTVFDFRITPRAGSAIGDGFAFVIQDQSESAFGEPGKELGYGGGEDRRIENSLAIEFDTYGNWDLGWDDKVAPHISIHREGNSSKGGRLVHTTAVPDFANGCGHIYSARIRYLSQYDLLEVYLVEHRADLAFASPILTTTVALSELLGLTDNRAWVGFTAATGDAAAASHDILNWYLISEWEPRCVWYDFSNNDQLFTRVAGERVKDANQGGGYKSVTGTETGNNYVKMTRGINSGPPILDEGEGTPELLRLVYDPEYPLPVEQVHLVYKWFESEYNNSSFPSDEVTREGSFALKVEGQEDLITGMKPLQYGLEPRFDPKEDPLWIKSTLTVAEGDLENAVKPTGIVVELRARNYQGRTDNVVLQRVGICFNAPPFPPLIAPPGAKDACETLYGNIKGRVQPFNPLPGQATQLEFQIPPGVDPESISLVPYYPGYDPKGETYPGHLLRYTLSADESDHQVVPCVFVDESGDEKGYYNPDGSEMPIVRFAAIGDDNELKEQLILLNYAEYFGRGSGNWCYPGDNLFGNMDTDRPHPERYGPGYNVPAPDCPCNLDRCIPSGGSDRGPCATFVASVFRAMGYLNIENFTQSYTNNPDITLQSIASLYYKVPKVPGEWYNYDYYYGYRDGAGSLKRGANILVDPKNLPTEDDDIWGIWAHIEAGDVAVTITSTVSGKPYYRHVQLVVGWGPDPSPYAYTEGKARYGNDFYPDRGSIPADIRESYVPYIMDRHSYPGEGRQPRPFYLDNDGHTFGFWIRPEALSPSADLTPTSADGSFCPSIDFTAKVSGPVSHILINDHRTGQLKTQIPVGPEDLKNDKRVSLFTVAPGETTDVNVVAVGMRRSVPRRVRFTNSCAGGDHPDDNVSASAYTLNFDLSSPAPGVRQERRVAVLSSGFFWATEDLAQLVGEPTQWINLDLDPATTAARYPVLLIPSGGLYGMESSPAFRARLEEYARRGGTVVAFAQQRGYEYAALPGGGGSGGLNGYGWSEDNSCFYSSLYLSEWHPVLSGFDRATLNAHVDGYFTSVPEGAHVLLSRSVNGQPGAVLYPFGQGWVFATTIYDDWGAGHGQSSQDARTLLRDLLAWAIDDEGEPEDGLPQFAPGETVSITLSLANTTPYTATGVSLQLVDPARQVALARTLSIIPSTALGEGIPPGGMALVPFTTTADLPLGIWRVDAALTYGTGYPLEATAQVARFAVADPAEPGAPFSDLSLSITAPTDHFAYHSVGEFTFHVFNHSDRERTATIHHGMPHHTWRYSHVAYYGNFYGRSRTLTIAPHSEATYVWSVPVLTRDRLWARLGEGGRTVASAHTAVYISRPAVDLTVGATPPRWIRGQPVTIEYNTRNRTKAVFSGTLTVEVYQPGGPVRYADTFPLEISPQGQRILTSTFTVPSDVPGGTMRIAASVHDHRAALAGGRYADFVVQPSPLVFDVSLPEPLTPSTAQTVTIVVTNTSSSITVTAGTLSTVFQDSQGVTATLATHTLALDPNEISTRQVPFTTPLPQLGEYAFIFTAADEYERIAWRERTASRLLFAPKLGRPQYRAGDTLTSTVSLINDGDFIEDLQVSVEISNTAQAITQTVSLLPDERMAQIYTFTLPLDIKAGEHPVVFTALQPSGGFVQERPSFSVLPSELRASLAQSAAAAGETVALTITNAGGEATRCTYALRVVDEWGHIVASTSDTDRLILAAESIDVQVLLPEQLATGSYTLRGTIIDQTSAHETRLLEPLDVDGLVVELDAFTDRETYLTVDPITVTAVLTNTGAFLEDGHLSLRITGQLGGTWPHWAVYGPTNSGLSANHLTSIAVDDAGNVWFGQRDYSPSGSSRAPLLKGSGMLSLAEVERSLLLRPFSARNSYYGAQEVHMLSHSGTWHAFDLPLSSASFLFDIAIDAAGNKWFASDEGIAVLSADNASWITYTVGGSGLVSNYINSIAFDTDGNAWFGTAGGVGKLAPDGTWDTLTSTNSPLLSDWVEAVAVDAAGNVWFGTDSGASVYLVGGTWTSYATLDGLLTNYVVDIAFDAGGNTWLATSGWNGGISVLMADGTWETYTPLNSDLTTGNVTAIAIDAAGRTWVGTDGYGIDILLADGTWNHYEANLGDALSGDYVNDIATAPNGDVWLATEPEGIDVDRSSVDRRRNLYRDGFINARLAAVSYGEGGATRVYTGDAWPLWERYDRENSELGGNLVAAVTVDAEGNTWFASTQASACFPGGTKVMLADRKEMPIEMVEVGDQVLSIDSDTGLPTNSRVVEVFNSRASGYLVINGILRVTASHPVFANDVWITAGELRVGDRLVGSSNRTVTVHSIKIVHEEVEVYNLHLSANGNFFAEGVLVHNMSAKLQWSEVYVNRLSADRTSWTTFDPPDTLLTGDVYDIAVDEAGNIWVGAENGASVYRIGEDAWAHYATADGLVSDQVLSVAADEAGNVWFGTTSGVSKLAPDGTWETFTPINSPLLSDWVEAVAVDAAGNVWFGTDSGASVYLAGGTWASYTTFDGLLTNYVVDIAFDAGGNTWLATSGWNGGISVLLAGGGWETYTVDNSDLTDGYVTAIAIDRAGRTWIGTYFGGIDILLDNGTWEHYEAGFNDFLSDNLVNDIAVAPSGDVWLATGPYDFDGGATRVYGSTSAEAILWSRDLTLGANSGEVLADVSPPLAASSLGATGKLYLQAELISDWTNQPLAFAEYPFYVFSAETMLTLDPDRRAYFPGAAVTISGQVRNAAALPLTGQTLTVWMNDQMVYAEKDVSVPAGGSHSYSLVTSAPLEEGEVSIRGSIESATVVDTIVVDNPELAATLQAPDVVGSAPFDLALTLDNPTLLDLSVTVELDGDVQTHVIPAGTNHVILYTAQVAQDTLFEMRATGDVTQTLAHAVTFGEAAEASFSPDAIYPEGIVAVPYTFENTGQLPVAFTTAIIVQPTSSHFQSSLSTYLPVGESATGTLLLDLSPGDYTLLFDSPFASGVEAFRVLPAQSIHLSASLTASTGSAFTVTADIANDGFYAYDGTLRLEPPFFSADAPISAPPDATSSYDLAIDAATADPSTYTATVTLLSLSGMPLANISVPFTVPDADIVLTSVPTDAVVTAGEWVTLTFGVANRGAPPATAVITASVGDLLDETQSVWLPGGASDILDFGFRAPDGLSGDELLCTYWFAGRRYDFVLAVAGVDLDVDGSFTQPVYSSGDTASLQLTVTNQSALSTPPLFAHVAYDDQVLTQSLSLHPGATTVIDFSLTADADADPKVFYAIYETREQRGIHLNTTYLYVASPELRLVPDRFLYEPGEMVHVAVQTTLSGTLVTAAPGFSTTLNLSGSDTSFEFILPADLARGTYAIDYALDDGPAHSIPFDVDAPWVRVTEARLKGQPYGPGDEVQADLSVASTHALDVVVRAWLVYPDGTRSVGTTRTVSLQDVFNNHVPLTLPLNTSQAGSYRLVYLLVDATNADLVYASGADTFDVGSVTVLGLYTDRETYPYTTDPVTATITLYAAAPTSASLDLLLDGTLVAGVPLSLTAGIQTIITPVPGPISPAWHDLTARVEAGGLSHAEHATFAYGTQTVDLAVMKPYLANTSGVTRTLAVHVYNRGETGAAPTTIQVWDGDPGAGGVLLGTLLLPELAAGESTQVELVWDVLGQVGQHTLVAIVDPDDVVAEFYEDNNVATSEVAVPPFELVIETGTSSYDEGLPVDVTVHLTNLTAAPATMLLTTTIKSGLYQEYVDVHTVHVSGTYADRTFSWDTSWAANGAYTIQAVGDLDVNSDEYAVMVNNVAPTVEAGPDRSAGTGQAISFSGSFADPGLSDTHIFQWDFDDGTMAGDALTTTHVYTVSGIYTVTLIVADDDGGVGSDTLLVTVNSAPPEVDAGPDQIANEGSEVTFIGAFTDPDSKNGHTIEWDFGDGTMATDTLTPTHVYTVASAYTVTLAVTDDEGSVGSDTLLVAVTDVEPVASIEKMASPTTLLEPGGMFIYTLMLTNNSVEEVTITALTDDAPGGDPLSAECLALVGTTLGVGESAMCAYSVTHTDVGSYDNTATVTIEDDEGNAATASDSATVTVTSSGDCELYPIALHVDALTGATVGQEIEDVYNGGGPGNFGWLSWTGDPSVPTLAHSLTPPGDSDTYINLYDPNDHTVSVGDWVRGKPGVSNAKAVRDALDTLQSYTITVPVWDEAVGQGNNLKYRVVGFAQVQITDYRLSGHDHISAIFLGYTFCGAPCPGSAPVDLLYVLDVSGSMNYRYSGSGTKLEAAKQAILKLNGWVSQLGNGSRVALLTFQGTGEVQGSPPHYPTDIRLVSGFTEDTAALEEAVLNLGASGSTPTAAALGEVADWLPGAWNTEHRPVVILISDGVPTVDLDLHGFSDRYVQGISLYDRYGNFRTPDEIRRSGKHYSWHRERAGEPLADTMVAIQNLKAVLPEATVYAVAVQGTHKGIFNDDVLRYVAARGDGEFFMAQDASGLAAALQQAFVNSACHPQLPVPWKNRDVGNVRRSGGAVYSDEAFIVDGGGSNIWGCSDEFHYVYQALKGDGEIVARVVSVESTHPWAKAGVMIRETLDANSRHAMMALTPWRGLAFQRRSYKGGRSRHTSGGSASAPYWVRLVREGDMLTGYVSGDGVNWSRVNGTHIAMADEVYIGLVVTAHNDSTLYTTRFDGVEVNKPQP